MSSRSRRTPCTHVSPRTNQGESPPRLRALRLRQFNSRKFPASFNQPLLLLLISSHRLRSSQLQMKEILAGHFRGSIIANRQPNLRAMPLVQIVWRIRPAHLRRDPPRLQRIRQNPRPAPRHAKRQQHIMKLCIGVGLRPMPPPLLPCQVFQTSVAVLM
jgi:hypothetical protein